MRTAAWRIQWISARDYWSVAVNDQQWTEQPNDPSVDHTDECAVIEYARECDRTCEGAFVHRVVPVYDTENADSGCTYGPLKPPAKFVSRWDGHAGMWVDCMVQGGKAWDPRTGTYTDVKERESDVKKAG